MVIASLGGQQRCRSELRWGGAGRVEEAAKRIGAWICCAWRRRRLLISARAFKQLQCARLAFAYYQPATRTPSPRSDRLSSVRPPPPPCALQLPTMAQLSAQPQLTSSNLHDSSPLNSLIRKTSARRANGHRPPNLEPRTPPRAAQNDVPPHSPILHANFRSSMSSTVTTAYGDGASMRTISWDARSGSPPSTPSSSYTVRAPNHAHESVASYDIDSITNRYRDTWRSSGAVDPPSVYDPPDIPTVVVSAAPEHEQEPFYDPNDPYAVPGPSTGGRVPSRVPTNNSINFSRPVQPVADINPYESEERKREVLMRNARSPHSPLHSPHSPATSPRAVPSPLGPTSAPSSRPVTPTSATSSTAQYANFPPSPLSPLPPPSAPALTASRVDSSTSVYSNYSYYELPPTPTGGAPPASAPAHTSSTPGAPHAQSSPQRARTKSSASHQSATTGTGTGGGAGAPQTAQDFLQLGIQHHLENRLAESAKAFERSATLGGGCGVGMLMWGLAQRHGWGVPKDEATGFRWLRRAAELAVADLEKGKQGDMSAVRVSVLFFSCSRAGG